MSDLLAPQILNELMGYELQSLAVRAIESTTFIPGLSLAVEPFVRKLASQNHKNAARLADVVSTLNASPGMRSLDAATGDLHFVDLIQALPRIVEYQQRLVRYYESAGPQLTETPSAAAIVANILKLHVTMLEELLALTNDTSASSS